LSEYQLQLTFGSVFTRNQYRDSYTVEAGISGADSSLIVLSNLGADAVKEWAVSKVAIEDGKFCHENLHSFFTLQGATKQYCQAIGVPWEDSIDDYS